MNEPLPDEQVREILELVRAGDARAETRLVNEFEPELRRLARLRMRGPSLRRFVDSEDICQSVFRIVFVKLRAGEYENLTSRESLLKLAGTMIRNKVIDYSRKPDLNRSVQACMTRLAEQEDAKLSPDEWVELREYLETIRDRLRPDEWMLLEERVLKGKTWDELAQELGETKESLRAKFRRIRKKIRDEQERESR